MRKIAGFQKRTSRFWRASSLVMGIMLVGGCDAAQPLIPAAYKQDAIAAPRSLEDSHMWMIVGEHRFAITLADSKTAQAFAEQMPLSLQMAEHNGNEKHAELPKALPTDASRPGTIRSGDLMLYGSKTLVVFYSTFKSSYSYTRIGYVNDPSALPQALGRDRVDVKFSGD